MRSVVVFAVLFLFLRELVFMGQFIGWSMFIAGVVMLISALASGDTQTSEFPSAR
jgi:hypothetical protein